MHYSDHDINGCSFFSDSNKRSQLIPLIFCFILFLWARSADTRIRYSNRKMFQRLQYNELAEIIDKFLFVYFFMQRAHEKSYNIRHTLVVGAIKNSIILEIPVLPIDG